MTGPRPATSEEVLAALDEAEATGLDAISVAWLRSLVQTETELGQRFRRLLTSIVDPEQCKDCGRTIWFIRGKSGKFNPVTDEGLSHFIDCPGAARFRRTP